MKDQNSYEEFILGTFDALLKDCALQYPGLAKEFNRDYKRLSSAIECHGIRFALDIMPAYRKHFDKCLDKQRLTATHLLHFGVGMKGGTIPRLFRGLILRVFDVNGVLRLDVDVDAVRWIRQLLGAVRKLRLASNIRDTGKVIAEFIDIDAGMRLGDLDWSSQTRFIDEDQRLPFSFVELEDLSSRQCKEASTEASIAGTNLPFGLLEKVQQVADFLTSQLGLFDPLDWRPKHGPGAVADHKFGAYKYAFDHWPARLESVFPYADFAVANYGCVDTTARDETLDLFYREYPARLCAVPKTLSTPRLIAAEPTYNQWCQQIVRDYLYTRVQTSTICGFIDFRRQDLNGALALKASHDAGHATIDLSSASDRISCWHVERLFRCSPSLLRALWASRSEWLEQKICRVSPRRVRLRKFSTMGNATTFPVQSLFFLALALGSVLHTRNLPVSARVMRSLGRGTVRVFGDDIVVPRDSSGCLMGLIQALELRVNPAKTFTEGNFRESCGTDAFMGHVVTSVSIMDIPKRARPESIVSSVDVHNNLCEKGLVCTADYIRQTAGPLVHNKIREVEHGSGYFGWSSLYGYATAGLKTRHSKSLHRPEVKCLRLTTKDSRLPAEGNAGLLQYFVEAPSEVTSAVSTLGYLDQRPKVKLSLGWVSLH